MATMVCTWHGCERLAQVVVRCESPSGPPAVHGVFCVPHAGLRSRALRDEGGVEVWLDWIRGPAVGADGDGVASRHRTTGPVRHAPRGAPRIRGSSDDAGSVDPVG